MAERVSAVITAEDPPGRGGTPRSDVAAVDQFLASNRAIAWRVARSRTRSDADADDALAEGTERFWRAVQRGRLDDHPDPRGYLLRAIRSSAIDQGRGAAHQARLRSTDRSDEPPSPDVIALTDDHSEVHEILARLPPGQRDAIELIDGHGLSSDEAGERLGLDPNAVRQLVFRARRNARLRWAARTVGPAVTADCDDVTLLLFKGRDDDTVVHVRECDRCQALGDEIAAQGRLRRALILLPWPSVALVDRLRSPSRMGAAGAAAAVAVAAIAGASMLTDGDPTSSRPAGTAGPSLTVPAALDAAPPAEAVQEPPGNAAAVPDASAGQESVTAPPRPTRVSPTPPEVVERSVPAEEAPAPPPLAHEPSDTHTVEVTVDIGEVEVDIGLGPPSDDPLVIELRP